MFTGLLKRSGFSTAKSRFTSLISALLCGAVCSFADTITLSGKKEADCSFSEFKNNKFVFRVGWEDKEVLRKRVKSLVIDSVGETTVILKKGKKKRTDLKLKRYDKNVFIFEEKGKELKIPGLNIVSIEYTIQTDLPATPGGGVGNEMNPPPDHVKEIDITTLLKVDVANVIHFHMMGDKANPAIRMENYISNLPNTSKGKIAVAKVDVYGWLDPNAKKYELKSFPQFWFYNREGALIKKLVDRFTSDDIDRAVKSARKAARK